MDKESLDGMLDQHLSTLAERLAGVPELQPALGIIATDPEHARSVYRQYVELIGRMAVLNTEDIASIDEAQHRLRESKGEVGSASGVGANDILAELDGQPSMLTYIALQSFDSMSPYYEPALNTLVERMEGGHEMKVAGKTPSDHDADSREVIWGHTVINDQNPEALLHFTICHYLERYFAKVLSAQDIELAEQKDFFINALVDVVLRDHQKNRGDTAIFEMWSEPKATTGLGWINGARLKSYPIEIRQ
jgi:hypothetical protein